MGFASVDIDTQIEVNQAIPAAAYTADAETAAGIDCQGYREAVVVVNYGVITDGTITPSVTSSDTLGGSYTAEANVGVPVAGTAGTDLISQSFFIDVTKAKRFVKVLLTETVASAGWDASAEVVGVLKRVNSTDV